LDKINLLNGSKEIRFLLESIDEKLEANWRIKLRKHIKLLAEWLTECSIELSRGHGIERKIIKTLYEFFKHQTLLLSTFIFAQAGFGTNRGLKKV